jgi:hypothetical protein
MSPSPPSRNLAGLFPGAAGDPPVNDGTWSDHPLWQALRRTRLRLAEGGRVRAGFPEDVLKLHGQSLSITGFMKPAGFVAWTEGMGEFQEFVLSRYAPDCPYCPAAGPTETIQVFLRQAAAPSAAMVTVEGVLELQDRMERGAFYRMTDSVTAT